MKSLEDIIFNELKTEDIQEVIIAEGFLPMNPILAYYTLKRNSLKNLKKVSDATAGKAKKALKDTKGKALVGREKLRADLEFEGGKDKDATVYKLTKKQTEVLSRIYEKNGQELISEIMAFRKNVLAPYQVIKRQVKKSKTLTTAETFGMTKEQFKSALESGRRKIEARGTRWEKFGDLEDKIEKHEATIADLETVKKGINSNSRIPPSILERILKEYDLGKKEFESYSMNDLKKAYFEVTKNIEKIGEVDADDDIDTVGKAAEINRLVKRNIDLRKGRVAKKDVAKRMEVRKAETDEYEESFKYSGSYLTERTDLTKNKNFRLSNGGFNSALGLYFLRRTIMDQLKPEKPNSIYRETYVRIVDQLIADSKKRKGETFAKISKNKSNVEFNEKERKIWELRPSVGTPTGDIKDYVQKLKEEDFFNPKYFKKSDKLIKAEKAIEAGIKRFERSLKKKVSKEDYDELKKYRLINNLITVGELKSPDKLFKSPEELQSSVKNSKETNFISDTEFERKIREIAKASYDSITDLNAAKKEAQDLFDTKEEQGDEESVDKMKGILTQIKNRKSIKAKDVVGSDVAMTDDDLVDAGMIEKEIKKMLAKDYEGDDDQLKKDKIRLNKLVDKYKEDGGDDAESNLEEIDFLFKKLKSKTHSLDYKDE